MVNQKIHNFNQKELGLVSRVSYWKYPYGYYALKNKEKIMELCRIVFTK